MWIYWAKGGKEEVAPNSLWSNVPAPYWGIFQKKWGWSPSYPAQSLVPRDQHMLS